ncbi:hypothetical protein EBQ74_01075 [bacterium]|nr:hypothetical protein [bacterium]
MQSDLVLAVTLLQPSLLELRLELTGNRTETTRVLEALEVQALLQTTVVVEAHQLLKALVVVLCQGIMMVGVTVILAPTTVAVASLSGLRVILERLELELTHLNR